MTGGERARVLCFGEALVDLFPEDQDARGRLLRDIEVYRRYSGGAPANTAVGLARLGVPTTLLTSIAADEFGEFLMASLQREGVRLLAARTDACATSLAFVGWDADGDRHFAFYRRHGADELIAVEHVDACSEHIRNASMLHCCTNTLIRDPMRGAHLRALEIAAEADVPVAVDLNVRVHLWPQASRAYAAAKALAARARLLKADADEAQAITGSNDAVAAARALVADGRVTEIACVTLGPDGAAWAHRSGSSGHCPAPSVEVVDTTGAGDAFTAALMEGWLRAGGPSGAVAGSETEEIISRAVKAGTVAVTKVGATTAMCTAQELDRFC